MHETTLVNNVVEIVLKEAGALEVEKVTAVYLTIGNLRDIAEDLFEGVFGYLTRGTIAQGAELVIRRIPITLRCKTCGYVFHFNVRDESTHQCPMCLERNYTIHSGLEFSVDGIETEPAPLPSLQEAI